MAVPFSPLSPLSLCPCLKRGRRRRGKSRCGWRSEATTTAATMGKLEPTKRMETEERERRGVSSGRCNRHQASEPPPMWTKMECSLFTRPGTSKRRTQNGRLKMVCSTHGQTREILLGNLQAPARFFAFDGPCRPWRSDRAGIGIRALAERRDVSSANANRRPTEGGRDGLDLSSPLWNMYRGRRRK